MTTSQFSDLTIDITKGLTKEEKLSIVGELIGRTKRIHEDDIYQCMLDINDWGKKITIDANALQTIIIKPN